MFFFKLEFKVSAYGFPLTLIISSRDRQWCTGSLLAVTRLHFPPVLEPIDWVCLLLPTTLMSSLIVLLCPRTQRLEKLCCTSGLFWPSLCTCSVGSQSPEPSRHGVARPMDSWQPDNGVMSFWGFFFFKSPTESDVYVIDFSPAHLSDAFTLQCTKQDWVQAWSMHCFSFSVTLEWAEDTKGYTGEVWQG